MLSITPATKIVATILAKNEADIIGPMIQHHLQQGVWKIIFTDNGSTDETRRIVERFPEVVEIIDEPGTDHNQAQWVTRMAHLACKLQPDWIVHLDADELWCGLSSLRCETAAVLASERMYLHPPAVSEFSLNGMRRYLDFDHLPIAQELKVIHRPDPDIEIVHGNHGAVSKEAVTTRRVYRHHYPIRSAQQWFRKAQGHLCLRSRNSTCDRWQKWYNMLDGSNHTEQYKALTEMWGSFCKNPESDMFISLMNYWATPEMILFFEQHPEFTPFVREWPMES